MKTISQPRTVTPMSDAAKRRLLLGYAAKAEHILPGRGQELAAQFRAAEKDYEANKKETMALLERAAAGDEEAQQEVQAIVIWTVENFLTAQSNYVGYFETGTLGESDVAYIENVNHHEVYISLVGQDGGAPRWQRQRERTQDLVPFYILTTGELEYRVMDLYTGKIADRSKANLDLSGDLNSQLDVRLFVQLQGLIGPFTITGDELDRVYLPNNRINTANLPTTNLLVPGDNTATTLFRKSCLDVVIAYARAWGENTFSDGPLVPVAIAVPSAHITGFLADCAINDPDNALNRQVFDFGLIMNYGGYKWMFIADPTLDPAEGLAYVQFNKKVGRHWTKPSMDKVLIDNSIALQKENLETMYMQKCFATAIPAPHRVNIAAIKYRD